MQFIFLLFFEILTLKQLGRHNKPIGILNTDGFYHQLESLLQTTVEKGFMDRECLALYYMSEDPADLLRYIKTEAAL